MKKLFLIGLFLCLFASVAGAEEAREFKVGEAVGDFTLADTSGETFQLSQSIGKVIVIVFWSSHCPYVKRYEERLKQIAADYKSKGVIMIAIASNIDETPEGIRQEVENRHLPYRVLLDLDHKVADEFGAISTPHIFIIDSFGELAYEGAVDDQGWDETGKVKENYTRDVLDAILAGNSPPHYHSMVFGCSIKREKTVPPA